MSCNHSQRWVYSELIAMISLELQNLFYTYRLAALKLDSLDLIWLHYELMQTYKTKIIVKLIDAIKPWLIHHTVHWTRRTWTLLQAYMWPTSYHRACGHCYKHDKLEESDVVYQNMCGHCYKIRWVWRSDFASQRVWTLLQAWICPTS